MIAFIYFAEEKLSIMTLILYELLQKCGSSPIYTTEKTWSGPINKLVRIRYFCRVNLEFLYNIFMKRVRTHFFLVLGP